MGEPGSTGVLLAHMPFNDGNRVAACLECATAIRDNGPAARLDQCRTWLDVGVLSDGVLAAQATLLEQRAVAIIQLYPDPDLSHGPNSIAGRFSPQANTNGKKNLKVPFVFKSIEAMAFPLLFPFGRGGWNGQPEELLEYTLMRLYSVDPRWREQEDYVVFSIQRLVAFGVWQDENLACLPPPRPIGQARAVKVSFLSFGE